MDAMNGKTLECSWKIDTSEGSCGAVCPWLPEVSCGIANVNGESIHLLVGGHIGEDTDGSIYGWPQRSSPQI